MKNLSKKEQVIGLVAWLVACFAAAGVGAMASIQAQSFYGQLAQPSWAPPPTVFGPVWTALYAMMAISAWLIWRVGGFRAQRIALTCFLVQLVANTLWSWFFFAWHKGAFAFVDIVLLWLLLVYTICKFWKVRPLAGAMLIPYLMWVSFAAALNLSLWQMNTLVLG